MFVSLLIHNGFIFLLAVRSSYQKVLKYLQGDDPLKAPQFRTWFYVYRNNTVEDDFKGLIEKNYYVNVKDIERDYYDRTEPSPPSPDRSGLESKPGAANEDLSAVKADPIVKEEKLSDGVANEEKPKEELPKSEPALSTENQAVQSDKSQEKLLEKEKTVENPLDEAKTEEKPVEKLVENRLEKENSAQKPLEREDLEEKSIKSIESQVKSINKPKIGGKDNSKDVIDFEEIKKTEPIAAVDEGRIDSQTDSSKFDAVVDDHQYVEVPVIKEQMEKLKSELGGNTAGENLAESASSGIVSNIENSAQESGLADEKRKIEEAKVAEKPKEYVKEEEIVKSSLPLKQFEELEIMQADESRFGKAVCTFRMTYCLVLDFFHKYFLCFSSAEAKKAMECQ